MTIKKKTKPITRKHDPSTNALTATNMDSSVPIQYQSSAKELATQQVNKLSEYLSVVDTYLINKVPQLEKLEEIFNFSVPHYSLFYSWFVDNVRYHEKAQTQLKVFSDHFFKTLIEFGYKKTTSTKVFNGLLVLTFLIHKKSIQKTRNREGLLITGLFLEPSQHIPNKLKK